MRENAVDLLAQENIYCEALFVSKDAERLQETTLLTYYGVRDDDAETDPSSPDLSMADRGEIGGGAYGIELCAERVQSAARAVEKESRRLQSETERYAAELLIGTTRDASESDSTTVGDSAGGNRYDLVLEALAIAREAERLQGLVVRMLARVSEPAGEGETCDD